VIRSPHNRQYKRWRRLIANPEKSAYPWIPVEGRTQVTELARNHVLELLLFRSGVLTPSHRLFRQALQAFPLSGELFATLTRVESTQGIIGFFAKPSWTWSDMTPYVLYLDRLQDPGNLGTLLRTAAATGLFSVITSPGTVSCFKDKVVRSSAGYLFHVPFLEAIPLPVLVERKYRLFVAHPRAGKSAFEVVFDSPLALVVGSESDGVDLSQIEVPAQFLHLPMHHTSDSLNAAVAGSVLMYEVIRNKSL